MKNGEQNGELVVEVNLATIDKDELDREWIEQPDKYLEYAMQLAEANNEVNERKASLDVSEAEAELDIRSKPRKYKLSEPIREASVKLQIVLHPDVQKATRRLNKAKYRAGILSAAVTALDHRKRALEKLVDLHGQGYFAAPRMPKDEFLKGTSPKKRRAHAD